MKNIARVFWVIIFIPVSIIGLSQNNSDKNNLKKQLWGFADIPYDINKPEGMNGDLLEPLNSSEVPEAGYVEDLPNGYLFIREHDIGEFYYETEIGAFKASDGYVLLKVSKVGRIYSCVASRSWNRILPEELDLEYFYKNKEQLNTRYCIFYIGIDIPKYGREVTFTTKLSPFGKYVDSPSGSVYTGNLLFESGRRDCSSGEGFGFSYIRFSVPDQLMEKETYSVEDLTKLAALIYKKEMSNSWNKSGPSAGAVEEHIMSMYNVYTEYQKINKQTITMVWNTTTDRFEIKKVEIHKKTEGFLNFLRMDNYWTLGQ